MLTSFDLIDCFVYIAVDHLDLNTLAGVVDEETHTTDIQAIAEHCQENSNYTDY